MLQYRLYDGKPLPANLQGFLKAGANIGSVVGQFGFGKNYPSFSNFDSFLTFRATQDTLLMPSVVKPSVRDVVSL